MPDNSSIKGILNKIEQELNSCGIEDAWLEASLLVEAFSGFDRLEQLRRPQRHLTGLQIKEIEAAVQERCWHKPLAQILGETCFYGRLFYVNADVLTPRSDTEILVEAVASELKERYRESKKGIRLLDTCTGSACIGISILLECRETVAIDKMDLADTSAGALEIARRNAERYALTAKQASFFCCDLWPDAGTVYDVITCNPPYINEKDMTELMPEVAGYEPQLALYGGRKGLDYYFRLAEEAAGHLSPGGILAVEHAYDQREAIKEIFAASPLKLLKELNDYGGNARVLIFEMTQ
ncbi:MAG: peptide chain release factor N(5)-glutamine methyltransferase [Clostridiaceae bacterium]|jgi:release factor glutamine methyltransferase|nr:peptide chain release factor N(5)-glutamine methyltransferase [Clostridiaceae bacterium]